MKSGSIGLVGTKNITLQMMKKDHNEHLKAKILLRR